MGWDENESLEAENNTMWKGCEVATMLKKKNCNEGSTTSAAEDAQSEGASCSWGSSSSRGGTGNSNGHQGKQPKQGSFQTNLGFRGSQEQMTSICQRQQNSNLDGGRKEEGWVVESSHRYRSSNSHSTANKAKSGLSASTGFKEDAWARETKVDFGGAAQNPVSWVDKSRNNKGWDQAYESANKPQGFKDGINPEKKGQKNLRVDNWGTRHQGWQPENKLEMNRSWAMLQSHKPEFFLESTYIKSNRESGPIHSARAQGFRWGSRVNNSTTGSGKDSAPGSHETAEISHVRNDALPILLPPEQLQGVNTLNDDRGAYQSGSGSESQSMESDDDLLASGDDDDSDTSDVSHKTQKKNKWFRKFFQSLDALTIENLNDSERQWHCPACQGGVGAIDWYKGMQPLLSHAKTIRSKRVKLHRKLAQVLEEELNRRGAAGLNAEGMFGKWKGLGEVANNKQIVWPPMVVIQNTFLDQDDNDMWHGMGDKELFEYFKGYKAIKARHAYGPNGHQGMSILIFEDSAMGYLEADLLHKHFVKEGRGKEDWDRRRVLFHPGGKRVLYGYIATQEDMDIFNKHFKGKTRLKHDMSSYQMMVVEPMQKMNEDNQKLIWFKIKVAKEQEHNKILEEAVNIVGRKLRMKESEIKIIRQRATEQHEENMREMNYLEQSYRQQIQQLYKDITRREHSLEKMQVNLKKERIDRFHQLEVHRAKLSKDMEIRKDEQKEEARIREEIAKQKTIVESSIKETEEYERERQELIRDHDGRRREFRIRQLREEVDSEKLFEHERFQMLDKFSKKRQEAASSIS